MAKLTITRKEVEAGMNGTGIDGFCGTCLSDAYGVELDDEMMECVACGAHTVYGIAAAIRAGIVGVVDRRVDSMERLQAELEEERLLQDAMAAIGC